MAWLANNLGFVLTFAVLLAGVFGTWAVNGNRIKRLESDGDKKDIRIHDLELGLAAHKSDSTIHLDPHRDQAIWKGFQDEVTRRFDGIDRKIDTLMLVAPTPPI